MLHMVIGNWKIVITNLRLPISNIEDALDLDRQIC